MAAYNTETVISVHHWNDTLFSFRTTRSPSLRFESGHFVMLGLEIGEKPLVRAYSMASASYDAHLEFFSIKVPNGPLTSRLQHLKSGDQVLVSQKSVGTLVADDLLPGNNVYLFGTGTGLAPFLSIIQEPGIYERFNKVVLVHSVRRVSDLAYADKFEQELPDHPLVGEAAREKFIYLPTVTREQFRNMGRITHLIKSGELAAITDLPDLNPETDRAMLCGSTGMLQDLSQLLELRGFTPSQHRGHAGHYVIEKAFAER
jgi:ferredoxin--NADP+ reductase